MSIEIPGLSGKWVEIKETYTYNEGKGECPSCGGFGIPWAGWFNCEKCPCKAVIESGRAFIPIQEDK